MRLHDNQVTQIYVNHLIDLSEHLKRPFSLLCTKLQSSLQAFQINYTCNAKSEIQKSQTCFHLLIKVFVYCNMVLILF